MPASALAAASNVNSLWAALLIEELIRNDVNYFCLSPGSRSAPLTVAAARHSGAKTIVCHDERGAGFHALGYARATGKPAVLISTSGTAAANYFPAVIEAAMDQAPLLILSADRPPELLSTGANQTIVQNRLFGEYPKWRFEFPCPDERIPPQTVLTTVDQAVHQALTPPAGPVHLNCPFREPLAPVAEPWDASCLNSLTAWLDGSRPFTGYARPERLPTAASVRALLTLLKATRQGILAAGRLNPGDRQAVLELAQVLGWPVFADIASGLRLGNGHPLIAPCFDQLLLSPAFRNRHRPDTVLHIGGRLTSKRFAEFLEQSRPRHYLMIKDHPFRHDPSHNVTWRLEADIRSTCLALAAEINRPASSWGLELAAQSARVDEVISGFARPEQPVSEIALARLISEHIPPDHGLWLGNSMPVRDMDMYGKPGARLAGIGVNRGASGIDGALATATGFAAGLQRPVTVILGDLSLLHDLNSLLMVKQSPCPVTVIAINNDGGGIFSFLPIAGFNDVFEGYFATPHGLSFRAAAELFALPYFSPRTNGELVATYHAALQAEQSALIEVFTDRQDNHRRHQLLQQQIVERLESGC